jgi:hypothetical protein
MLAYAFERRDVTPDLTPEVAEIEQFSGSPGSSAVHMRW